MTNPSKSVTENNLKSNATIEIDSVEKNKMINSILNSPENYSYHNSHNKTQKISLNQSQKIQSNDKTTLRMEMNRMSSKNRHNETVDSPKKYREDLSLYNSRENTIHNEFKDENEKFTFNRNKNTEIDDSIENFEITKEPFLNRYNFQTDFVVTRVNKNSENNHSKINKAPRRDTENSINYIHSNQTNSRVSLDTLIIPSTNNLNYLKLKPELSHNEPKDQKAIDRNLTYYQGKEKRLQELNLMNSYIDSLSQISLNTGPLTQSENKSRKNILNENKTNLVVYLPSQLIHDQEVKNEDESRMINKSSLYNSNNILNDNSKNIKTNICLDSQIEQESIRHEISKKLKNQVYEKEYARVNHQIDYVNERLKLNELSKSYLMTKINEYSVKANEESENITEYDNNIGIIFILK